MSDVDDGSGAVGASGSAGDLGVDRGHRAAIEFGLDAADAERLVVLVDAAVSEPDELDGVVDALAEPDIAEAAWVWWSDDDLLGPSLDVLIDRLTEVEDPPAGVVWLRARHLAWHGRTSEALELLEVARPSGNRLVLADLAAVE